VNNLYPKIRAIALTMLVLFSSSFVIVDEHYCCGKLIDSSIFGKAKVCEMDMPTCEAGNPDLAVLKDTCCSSNQQFKLGGIFKNSPVTKIDFQQLVVLSNINLYPQNTDVSLANIPSFYKNYSPPLITMDILVFIQCFRI